jgi:hypothetical protein
MDRQPAGLYSTFAIAVEVFQRHRLDPTGRCMFCQHRQCRAWSHADRYIRGAGIDPAQYDQALLPSGSDAGVNAPPVRPAGLPPYELSRLGDRRPPRRARTGPDATWQAVTSIAARSHASPAVPPLPRRLSAVDGDLGDAGNYRVTATAAVQGPAAWAISSRDFLPAKQPTGGCND